MRAVRGECMAPGGWPGAGTEGQGKAPHQGLNGVRVGKKREGIASNGCKRRLGPAAGERACRRTARGRSAAAGQGRLTSRGGDGAARLGATQKGTM